MLNLHSYHNEYKNQLVRNNPPRLESISIMQIWNFRVLEIIQIFFFFFFTRDRITEHKFMEISVLCIVTRTRYIPFRPHAFRIFIATPLSRLIIRFPYHALAWSTSVCKRNAARSGSEYFCDWFYWSWHRT